MSTRHPIEADPLPEDPGPLKAPKAKRTALAWVAQWTRGLVGLALLSVIGKGAIDLANQGADLGDQRDRRAKERLVLRDQSSARGEKLQNAVDMRTIDPRQLQGFRRDVLADDTITPDELQPFLTSSYHLSIAQINARLPKIPAARAAGLKGSQVEAPALRAAIGQVLNELQRHPAEQQTWKDPLGIINRKTVDEKTLAPALQALEIQHRIRLPFVAFSADSVVAMAQGLGVPVTEEGYQRLLTFEEQQLKGMVPELHAQASHRQGVAELIDTLRTGRAMVRDARQKMAASNLNPGAVPGLDGDLDGQLARIDTVLARFAQVKTVSHLYNQQLQDPGKRAIFEKQRDALYNDLKMPVPASTHELVVDLVDRAARLEMELLSNLHSVDPMVVRAESLLRQLAPLVQGRQTNRGEIQKQIDAFMTDSKDSKDPRVVRVRQQLEDLLKRPEIQIADLQGIMDGLTTERMRLVLGLADLYVDWAKQLADTFKRPEEVRQREAELLKAREDCTRGLHGVAILLVRTHVSLQRELSGYENVRTQVDTLGLPENGLTQGTEVRGLAAAQRRELADVHTPVALKMLDTIRDVVQVRFVDHVRDNSAYVVDGVRKLNQAARSLTGLPGRYTKRDTGMVEAMKHFDEKSIDAFESSLRMNQALLRDPRMDPVELANARRTTADVDIRRRADELDTQLGAQPDLAKIQEIIAGPALDRLALAHLVQRRIARDGTAFEASFGELLHGLKETGNQNTTILAEMAESANFWIWIALCGVSSIGLFYTVRAMRRSAKELGKKQQNFDEATQQNKVQYEAVREQLLATVERARTLQATVEVRDGQLSVQNEQLREVQFSLALTYASLEQDRRRLTIEIDTLDAGSGGASPQRLALADQLHRTEELLAVLSAHGVPPDVRSLDLATLSEGELRLLAQHEEVPDAATLPSDALRTEIQRRRHPST
jgi:hypothetical protein